MNNSAPIILAFFQTITKTSKIEERLEIEKGLIN